MFRNKNNCADKDAAAVDKNERKLIAQAKDGDQRAFAEIIRLYQKRLYYVIIKIVFNHEDADDVLQETFLKLYENLALFDERRPLYPWLLTIAMNTAINKKNWRTRKQENSIDAEDYRELTGDRSTGPEQTAEAHELQDALQTALSQLSLELRSVFVLRINEELSYKEISAMLGISEGTVMSRLARARQKLRVLLAPYVTNDVSQVKV